MFKIFVTTKFRERVVNYAQTVRELVVNLSGRCGRMRTSRGMVRIATNSSRTAHVEFTSSSQRVHDEFTRCSRLLRDSGVGAGYTNTIHILQYITWGKETHTSLYNPRRHFTIIYTCFRWHTQITKEKSYKREMFIEVEYIKSYKLLFQPLLKYIQGRYTVSKAVGISFQTTSP